MSFIVTDLNAEIATSAMAAAFALHCRIRTDVAARRDVLIAGTSDVGHVVHNLDLILTEHANAVLDQPMQFVIRSSSLSSFF